MMAPAWGVAGERREGVILIIRPTTEEGKRIGASGLPKWRKVAKVAKVANFLRITPLAPLAKKMSKNRCPWTPVRGTWLGDTRRRAVRARLPAPWWTHDRLDRPTL
jgi:hypothetical protein